MKNKQHNGKAAMKKTAAIKVSPRKLAKIIAECACQELAAQQSSSDSMSADDTGLKLPAAPRDTNTPSQASVDAGLFPGMGDSPALSDSGGNGGCGDSNVPEKPPIDHVEEPVTSNDSSVAADDDDDARSVELVIGSI